MTAYADDSTGVIAEDTEEELKAELDRVLEMLERYLEANKMKINKRKTEIVRQGLRIGTAEMDTLRIEATNKEGNKIGPVESCRLLGVQVARNMKWNVQIETHRDSVLKKIRKRLGVLKFVGRFLSLDQRYQAANGLILSIVIYNIQL